MSATQVLATLTSALQDGATGLAAKITAIATVLGAPYSGANYLRTDISYGRWQLDGNVLPGDAPQLILSPNAWRPQQLAAATVRDADCEIQFDYELVAGDVTQLQDNLTVVASALLEVLDSIERYSATHNGTIILLRDPVAISFGTFRRQVTAGGFSAVATFLERSTL